MKRNGWRQLSKNRMKRENPYLPEVANLPKVHKKRLKPNPQPKKRGRKRVKRKFDEVDLGYYLRLNAPLEYDIIISTGGKAPSADLIEAISYASINPYFRSVEFRRLLIQYRVNGCYQLYPKSPPSPKTIRRYARERKEQMLLKVC